jgi:ribose transport system permease protein
VRSAATSPAAACSAAIAPLVATPKLTGVAGVVLAARLNSAQPALGQGYELEAIAAVVIGGTSLAGGRGTILGTLIGALIMSVMTNGLRILSVAPEWQIVATGAIIIGAVYADSLRKK